jgi:hypothetical protein
MPLAAAKINQILDYYERKLRDLYAELDPNTRPPGYIALSAKRHTGECKKTSEEHEHMLYCIVTLREMLGSTEDNREKVMRWLGFLQGAFWADGVFCVTDLMFHNTMPVSVPQPKAASRPKRKASVPATSAKPPGRKTFKNIGFDHLGDMPSGVFVTFTSINQREEDALPVFTVCGAYRTDETGLVKRRIVCVRQAAFGSARADAWVPVTDKLNLCEQIE